VTNASARLGRKSSLRPSGRAAALAAAGACRGRNRRKRSPCAGQSTHGSSAEGGQGGNTLLPRSWKRENVSLHAGSAERDSPRQRADVEVGRAVAGSAETAGALGKPEAHLGGEDPYLEAKSDRPGEARSDRRAEYRTATATVTVTAAEEARRRAQGARRAESVLVRRPELRQLQLQPPWPWRDGWEAMAPTGGPGVRGWAEWEQWKHCSRV